MSSRHSYQVENQDCMCSPTKGLCHLEKERTNRVVIFRTCESQWTEDEETLESMRLTHKADYRSCSGGAEGRGMFLRSGGSVVLAGKRRDVCACHGHTLLFP